MLPQCFPMTKLLSLCWLVCLFLSHAVAGQIPLPLQHGLQAAYYRDQNFKQLVYQTTDTLVNCLGQLHAPVSSRLSADHFSVRWTGYLYIPVTGSYELHLATNKNARLWLDDQLLLDERLSQQAHTTKNTRRLVGDRFYRLRIEQVQGPHSNQALLTWIRPDARPHSLLLSVFGSRKTTVLVAIPVSYFYSDLPVSPIHGDTLAVLSASLPKEPSVVPLTVHQVSTSSLPLTFSLLPEPHPVLRAQTVTNQSVLEPTGDGALQSLYFEQSRARLLPSSLPILVRLAQVLREQPTLRLQLVGHTDNIGKAELNQLLSQQRAAMVRNYLLRQGINANRVITVGNGGMQPVVDNAEETIHARNRRVDVVLW